MPVPAHVTPGPAHATTLRTCGRFGPRGSAWDRLACLVALAAGFAAATEPVGTTIVADVPTLTAVAAPASGQIVFCLDGASAAVIAVDPRMPETRRPALAASSAEPRPVAIACLDSNTLAGLCVDGDAWSVRTWRVPVDGAADPAAPLQTIPLGRAAERPAAAPRLTLGRSRDWLTVVGLPAPLPAVLRAPIAGVRLGPASDRGCPKLNADTHPVAAAAGPADELVIITSGQRGAGDTVPGGDDTITYYSSTGRQLLTLDTGLRGIRAAAFSRGDGSLWVVADGPMPGLFRLDATFDAGRQAIRGTPAARFTAAADLVSLGDRTTAVLVGTPERRLVRYELDGTEKDAP
ncbi:MAG: hypothetical protein ACK6CT_06195 [Planctomycetia bacterium]